MEEPVQTITVSQADLLGLLAREKHNNEQITSLQKRCWELLQETRRKQKTIEELCAEQYALRQELQQKTGGT